MNLKIMSFNVNGIRSRLNQLESVLKKHNPTIVGLQEIKVSDEEFPTDAVNAMGYEVSHFGQKGHYGVALLSKMSPTFVKKDSPLTRMMLKEELFMAPTPLITQMFM